MFLEILRNTSGLFSGDEAREDAGLEERDEQLELLPDLPSSSPKISSMSKTAARFRFSSAKTFK